MIVLSWNPVPSLCNRRQDRAKESRDKGVKVVVADAQEIAVEGVFRFEMRRAAETMAGRRLGALPCNSQPQLRQNKNKRNNN
jgi:hypothetical protein